MKKKVLVKAFVLDQKRENDQSQLRQKLKNLVYVASTPRNNYI